MSSRLAILVARREALVARSEAHRAERRTIMGQLHREIALVETVVGAARLVRRSGPLIGIAVAGLLVVGPVRIVRWFGSAARFAPYVIGAYRVARSIEHRMPDRGGA